MSNLAITPQKVFDWLYQTWGWKRHQIFDPFPFRTMWNNRDYFNGFTEDYPDRYIFCNPPYSDAALAIEKCIYEFYRGKNITLLIPEESIYT